MEALRSPYTLSDCIRNADISDANEAVQISCQVQFHGNCRCEIVSQEGMKCVSLRHGTHRKPPYGPRTIDPWDIRAHHQVSVQCVFHTS